MTEPIKDPITVQEIMAMLPHRYPFLMVDRILEYVPGESAIARKNVTFNEPHFLGHFPGHPIMPGVLIVEALAQVAAIVVVKTLENQTEEKLVYFMTIESAKFRKPVVPGDIVELHVQKVQNRGAVWKFEGKAIVDGKVCAEAVFSAMISDKPKENA
ncbi:MAG TPA: 3-hydroxyacyl-ACP dehydratase FabZ [Alphaproteobacteria bacterium]|nr:3-hydroxyacyl-ACP dehydratase FabZ [Alphaproteobacteria bacterium]